MNKTYIGSYLPENKHHRVDNRMGILNIVTGIIGLILLGSFIAPAVIGSIGQDSLEEPLLDIPNDTTFNSDSLEYSSQHGTPFIANGGQIHDPSILFQYQDGPRTLDFFESGYSVTESSVEADSLSQSPTISISFPGSSPATPFGTEQLPHPTNYLLGPDQSDWHTNIPSYESIIYSDLYPGIDLVFTSSRDGLKYDLLVSPGADPAVISIQYDCIDSLFTDTGGRLYAKAGSMELVEDAPFSYQTTIQGGGRGGERNPVESAFVVRDSIVSLDIGPYDPSLPLIIDPVIYSTYVGGDYVDTGYDLEVDGSGNVIVVGNSGSKDFPVTEGCFDDSNDAGQYDIVVFKLNASGTGLLYSTYIGGSGSDWVRGIDIDPDNNVYITGETKSNDFPTTEGCFDDSYNGGWDAFVLCLNSNGTELLFSTYLGSPDEDRARSIALDGDGNIFVTGMTTSEDFPISNPTYDPTLNGSSDVFVVWFEPGAMNLLFSTYLGGSDTDGKVDQKIVITEELIIVSGDTWSTDFPVSDDAFQYESHGESDAFLSVFRKSNFSQDSIIYSTFLGGSGTERVRAMEPVGDDHIIIAGDTDSGRSNVSSFQFTSKHLEADPGMPPATNQDIFIAGIDLAIPSLSSLTRFGGRLTDTIRDLTIDPSGNVVFAGYTESSDLPMLNGSLDPTHDGSWDGFVATISSDGSDLLYSTYLGADASDELYGITMDAAGDLYLTGATYSTSFPTSPECHQDESGGYYDAFVTKLRPVPFLGIILECGPKLAYQSQGILFRGDATNGILVYSYRWESSLNGLFYESSRSVFIYPYLSPGRHVISLSIMDSVGHWSKPEKTVIEVRYQPQVEILSILVEEMDDGHHVLFNTTASVVNSTIDRYVWESSIDGEFHNESYPLVTYDRLSPGDHLLTFRVQDNHTIWSDEETIRLLLNATSFSREGDEDNGSNSFHMFVAIFLGCMAILIMGSQRSKRKKSMKKNKRFRSFRDLGHSPKKSSKRRSGKRKKPGSTSSRKRSVSAVKRKRTSSASRSVHQRKPSKAGGTLRHTTGRTGKKPSTPSPHTHDALHNQPITDRHEFTPPVPPSPDHHDFSSHSSSPDLSPPTAIPSSSDHSPSTAIPSSPDHSPSTATPSSSDRFPPTTTPSSPDLSPPTAIPSSSDLFPATGTTAIPSSPDLSPATAAPSSSISPLPEDQEKSSDPGDFPIDIHDPPEHDKGTIIWPEGEEDRDSDQKL